MSWICGSAARQTSVKSVSPRALDRIRNAYDRRSDSVHIVKQDVRRVEGHTRAVEGLPHQSVTTSPLRWGVIGTGGIAADFCQALTRSARCRVVNVVGSSPSKAR